MSGSITPSGFSSSFNQVVEVEPEGGRAYYGLNVLTGLTTGITAFRDLWQPRWR